MAIRCVGRMMSSMGRVLVHLETGGRVWEISYEALSSVLSSGVVHVYVRRCRDEEVLSMY